MKRFAIRRPFLSTNRPTWIQQRFGSSTFFLRRTAMFFWQIEQELSVSFASLQFSFFVVEGGAFFARLLAVFIIHKTICKAASHHWLTYQLLDSRLDTARPLLHVWETILDTKLKMLVFAPHIILLSIIITTHLHALSPLTDIN